MSRSNSRLRTVVTVLIALFVVAAMVAPAALAHAQLLGSDPADGASLPTTDRVVLTFNEDINPDFVQVVVAGPDGPLPLAGPAVEGAVLTQPIAPVASGEHSLTYRVVSADGHPISGRIAFTLTDVPMGAGGGSTDGGSTEQAPTTPQLATAMSTAGVEPVTAAGDTDATDGAGPGSWWTWLVVAAVIAVLAAGGAWLARSRRHPQH